MKLLETNVTVGDSPVIEIHFSFLLLFLSTSGHE